MNPEPLNIEGHEYIYRLVKGPNGIPWPAERISGCVNCGHNPGNILHRIRNWARHGKCPRQEKP